MIYFIIIPFIILLIVCIVGIYLYSPIQSTKKADSREIFEKQSLDNLDDMDQLI
jgi:hypothetical protein